MAHRNPFKQNYAVDPLTKNLPPEKLESVDVEKPILPGDIMDIALEYSGVNKKEEKISFFNSRGMVSLNKFHSKLEAYHRPRITQLLDHVVKGRLASAEARINENPEYLFESGDSMDYSGRRFHRTALQAALAAKDVRFKDGMEEYMAEMIIRLLKTLPDGEEAIATQIEEQFPASWKENEAKENKKDLAAVEAVFQAIDKATSPEKHIAAIQTFRNYLKEKYLEKDGKPITLNTGFDFNDQMLLKAYQLYDSYFARFGNEWDTPKNRLAWCQVIGYLQRFLTACHAQAHAQGMYLLLGKHPKHFNRSFNFSGGDGAFFPLSVASGLGFDWAAGADRLCALYPGGAGEFRAADLQEYMSGKNIRMRELMQPLQDFRAMSRAQ